jgi:RNA recognition motif-containing protein
MRGTRSAGYGFVTVRTLEAAQKACEQLDKKVLEDRQMVVEVAKPSEQKDKERAERRAKRRAGRPRGRAPPGEVSEAEANDDADKVETANGISDEALSEAKHKPKKKKFAVSNPLI